jgi:hypothetical protein
LACGVVLAACSRLDSSPAALASDVVAPSTTVPVSVAETATTTTQAASTATPPTLLRAEPASVDVVYASDVEQRWRVDLGDIGVDDRAGTVTVAATFSYAGTGPTGSLLDLKISLADAAGAVVADWWSTPCAVPPADSIDVFATVAAGSSVTGELCFESPDASRVAAVQIAPLVDPIISIPVG